MTDAGRDVLVTGLGAVSCLGSGTTAFWEGVLAGGGEPSDVPEPYLNMRATKMYLVPPAAVPREPASLAHVPLSAGPRYAVAAAREAVADAGLTGEDGRRLPVVLGVEMGNALAHERERGPGGAGVGRWTPLTVTAAVVSAALGTNRSSVSVGDACSAGGYALGIALDMIHSGEADVVLVGGAEGVTRIGMAGFNRLGAADPVRCRPFDRHRKGTMFGDGAAMVVLESREHAGARGATPYAELAGVAWSCDAHHPTAPDPDAHQVLRCMQEALGRARIGADGIGSLLPHATGTELNDVVESQAVRRVFGDRTDDLPLVSLKAMIGHTAGAAAVFACLAAALMVRHRRVPPNPPLAEQDPECAVWLPQGDPVPLRRPAVMINAYAFGGNNSSMVLTAPGGAR